MIVPGNPWLVIENLWFLTLKPGRGREAVETVAQLWSTEVVMIGTQSVASCGVYAHYLGGTLRRFLSAGDGVWLEVFGTPEFWEDGAFKNYSELPYALKAETTFSDSTVLDAAQAFGCPRIDATVEVVAVF